ncbi:MAG: C39 family peptidase [Eubacterium sp.]|nr:C39 family peptidase [Eubacterium sp.]
MTRSEVITKRKKIRRKKQRRAIKRAVCMAALMTVIVAALRTASNYLLTADSITQPDTSRLQAASAVSVKQPVERHASQIVSDLKDYAGTSKTAARIYENRNQYTETLLAAYLNNPEMEDFIDGYLDAGLPQYSAQSGFTQQELAQEFPLFLQWDKRWGYVSYGGSIIGLSGCGPTCLSMVLVSLTGQESQTPDAVAHFSEERGYYVEGSGTAWSLMTEGASQLGLYARELSLDESVMKSSLDAGRPIICSMGPGDFTTQGHFILIYGYDQDGFLINDPNCIARSSKSWSFEALRGQIKNLWAYSAA